VEYLPKAPIQEALIDIRVVTPPDLQVASLKTFGNGLEQRFPESKEKLELAQSFQFSPTGEPQPSTPIRRVDGYLFISKVDGKTVQTQMQGLTFNKLRPYSKWEEFSGEAKELWQRYSQIVKPQGIIRLGLRYINRIELSPNVSDLRELCVLFADIPQVVAGLGIMEYFQRFVTPRNNGMTSTINLAFDNAIPPGKPAIILDIDVWIAFQQPRPINDFWADFEALRVLKNEIFSASLTEKAKALFR
jgi:uncharacterized protein (TIGR04255 family)